MALYKYKLLSLSPVSLLEVSETSDGHLRRNPRHCGTLGVKRIPELDRLDDESLQQSINQ